MPFVIGALLLPVLAAFGLWLERNVINPEKERRRQMERLDPISEPVAAPV
jgi:hypothetical protein